MSLKIPDSLSTRRVLYSNNTGNILLVTYKLHGEAIEHYRDLMYKLGN